MRIWKWTLAVTDRQIIEMPVGAKILTIQMQGKLPQLWALCKEDAPKEKRCIAVYGTGNPVPDTTGEYIATFQMYGGSFVFHAFELCLQDADMGGTEAIVINMLIRWSHWKMGSGVSLGYPSSVSYARMMPGASVHDVAIDSECIQTDNAVKALPNDQYRLIRHEYIVSRDWKQSEKAAMLHISPSTYRRWIKDAHHQIAINLNMRCADNANNFVESFA